MNFQALWERCLSVNWRKHKSKVFDMAQWGRCLKHTSVTGFNQFFLSSHKEDESSGSLFVAATGVFIFLLNIPELHANLKPK